MLYKKIYESKFVLQNFQIKNIAEQMYNKYYNSDYDDFYIDNFKKSFKFLGVRCVSKEDKGYNLDIGDIIPNSYRWEDGEWTDEELNGTSAIDIADYKYISTKFSGGYFADIIFIIGGNRAEEGEDPNEIVIQNAVLIEKIKINS